MAKQGFAEDESPFNDVDLAHIIIDLIKKSGKSIKDEQALIKRMRHVEYGLNSETECSAIISWLGNCTLVHKLSCEGYIPSDIEIPDLFAVFEKNGQVLKTCIEVKSTEDLSLRWTNDYHSKLRAYCDILELPLLLAWKIRPFGQWLLLDPSNSDIVEDAKIHFGKALTENIMGTVAGDFRITPKSGIGMHITGQILKKEEVSEKASNVTLKISEAIWGDAQRNKFNNLTESEIALIMMLANNQYYQEEKGTAKWGYTTFDSESHEQTSVSSQDLLRLLVGFAKKEKERIAWRNVLQDLNSIKSKESILAELSDKIGSTVQYIFHQIPKTKPSFLSEGWFK